MRSDFATTETDRQPAPRSVAEAGGRWRRLPVERLRAGLRAALAGGLGEALWLFLTLRLTLSLFALMASVLSRLPGPCSPTTPVTRYTAGLPARFFGVWQRWDACWYEVIAAHGYPRGQNAVNFFPLLPLAIKVASFPLGGNLTLSALAVSGIAYIAAMTGLYHLICRDFDEEVARRTVLYCSVFPTAFFFFAGFTEALFLALAVWAIFAARQGRWALAAPFALAIGLTRPQGILLAAPLGWEFARQWWDWRRAGKSWRYQLPAAFVPFLPLYGFLLFVTYSDIFVGKTPLETQQGAWGNKVVPPWAAMAASWRHLRARGDLIETANLTMLVLFTLILILGIRRLPLTYSLYAAPQLLLTASHHNFLAPLLGTVRYVLVLFPVFVVVALTGKHRRLHYSWLLLSALLLGFFFYAFLHGTLVA